MRSLEEGGRRKWLFLQREKLVHRTPSTIIETALSALVGSAQRHLKICRSPWVCVSQRKGRINYRHLPVLSSHLLQPTQEISFLTPETTPSPASVKFAHLSGNGANKPPFLLSRKKKKTASRNLEICPENLKGYLRDISTMCVLGKLPQEENYRLMHMQGFLVPRFFYSKWFCLGGGYLFVCVCLFLR